jgi:hypothetical protein
MMAGQPKRRSAAFKRLVQVGILLVLWAFFVGGVVLAAIVLVILAAVGSVYRVRKKEMDGRDG